MCIPPDSIKVDLLHCITSLCSWRKIIRRPRRRVGCQLEADYTLHAREGAWLGTARKGEGDNITVRSQLDKVFVDVVPDVAVDLDDTEG
jgi:hypothetical protein